jgi:hypothetical protein
MNTRAPSRNTDIAFWLILTASVVWAFILPPAFGGTDVYGFKDAACNLAAGLGFKSVNFIGSKLRPFRPELFANYPPLFPLAYGLYAKLFGCNPTADKCFNLLVSALSSVLAGC